MKKIIFKIGLDHSIDLITNSSSELFVLNGQNKEIVTAMIAEMHPDWQSEYEEPIRLNEMSTDQIITYLDYSRTYNENKLPNGITIDQMFEKQNDGTYRRYGSIWINYKWCRENEELFKAAVCKDLDPNGNMWFMFSIDQNPNYEMQENLMSIAERYHLG